MKRKTIANMMREQSSALDKLSIAALGHKPSKLESAVLGYLDWRKVVHDVKSAPPEIQQQAKQLVGFFRVQLSEILLQLVRKKDAAGMRVVAELLENYDANHQPVDPLRTILMHAAMDAAMSGVEIEKVTSAQWADAVNFKGDMDYFRRVLKELEIPYEKQKGGAPKTPTSNDETADSES